MTTTSYQFKTNPLKRLGYPSYLDYGIFKKYLRLPPQYLRAIFQLYPSTLQQVPLELSNTLNKCDEAHWRRVKMSSPNPEEKMLMVKYKIAKVPPMYMQNNSYPACSGPTLKIVTQLIENPQAFSEMGRVVYFHSLFEDNSLLAASNIIKAGVRSNLKCSMLPFTKYMEEARTFETSTLIEKMKEADIACFYCVGVEYLNKESGFTETHLEEFVKARRIQGKSTILSSHLSPSDFAERYKMSLDRLGATAFKFDDGTMTLTLAELGRELEEIKKKKEVNK